MWSILASFWITHENLLQLKMSSISEASIKTAINKLKRGVWPLSLVQTGQGDTGLAHLVVCQLDKDVFLYNAQP